MLSSPRQAVAISRGVDVLFLWPVLLGIEITHAHYRHLWSRLSPMSNDPQTTIEPVIECLPVDFDEILGEAKAEGYRFVERLRDEWHANVTRFDHDDETLLVARVGETLAAIGGITRDPVAQDALRMRRFYVRCSFRGQGFGRQLVKALLEHPRRSGRTIMVNAGGKSSPFWEALGFAPDMRDGHTHILRQPSIGND